MFFAKDIFSISRLADLSVYVQGHVGGVLEGRPMFCVQAASAECYAYNKVTKHWDQVWRNSSVLKNTADLAESHCHGSRDLN